MKLDYITQVKRKLSAFATILTKLEDKQNNLVLGGTYALLLHGIKIGREPGDVDIVIYNPTERQKEILELLKDVDTIENRPYDGTGVRAISLKREIHNETYKLDILVERENMPKGLLEIRMWNENYPALPVQSVDRIIDAKASYNHQRSTDGKIFSNYIRSKDVRDMIQMKNLNFNMEKESCGAEEQGGTKA